MEKQNTDQSYVHSIYESTLNDFKVEKIKADAHLNRKDLRLTVDNPEDLVVCRKIYSEFVQKTPHIDLEDIISFLDKNADLKALTFPLLLRDIKPCIYNHMKERNQRRIK